MECFRMEIKNLEVPGCLQKTSQSRTKNLVENFSRETTTTVTRSTLVLDKGV